MYEHYDEIEPHIIADESQGVLTLKGVMTDKMKEFILSGKFHRLVLSYGKWEDLKFIADENIEFKSILLRSPFIDWSSISKMISIERLILDGKLKPKIDFSELTNLRELDIHWEGKKTEGMLKLKNLKILTIYGYKGNDLELFHELISLEELEVVRGSIVSLSGLQALKSLKRLDLFNVNKLVNVDELNHMDSLIKFGIESCNKIIFPKFFNGLGSIIQINLCRLKGFNSLKIFEKLKTLESLNVYEMKVEDGDIEIVKEFNGIKSMRIDQKRHYNMDVDAYKKELIDKYGEIEVRI